MAGPVHSAPKVPLNTIHLQCRWDGNPKNCVQTSIWIEIDPEPNGKLPLLNLRHERVGYVEFEKPVRLTDEKGQLLRPPLTGDEFCIIRDQAWGFVAKYVQDETLKPCPYHKMRHTLYRSLSTDANAPGNHNCSFITIREMRESVGRSDMVREEAPVFDSDQRNLHSAARVRCAPSVNKIMQAADGEEGSRTSSSSSKGLWMDHDGSRSVHQESPRTPYQKGMLWPHTPTKRRLFPPSPKSPGSENPSCDALEPEACGSSRESPPEPFPDLPEDCESLECEEFKSHGEPFPDVERNSVKKSSDSGSNDQHGDSIDSSRQVKDRRSMDCIELAGREASRETVIRSPARAPTAEKFGEANTAMESGCIRGVPLSPSPHSSVTVAKRDTRRIVSEKGSSSKIPVRKSKHAEESPTKQQTPSPAKTETKTKYSEDTSTYKMGKTDPAMSPNTFSLGSSKALYSQFTQSKMFGTIGRNFMNRTNIDLKSSIQKEHWTPRHKRRDSSQLSSIESEAGESNLSESVRSKGSSHVAKWLHTSRHDGAEIDEELMRTSADELQKNVSVDIDADRHHAYDHSGRTGHKPMYSIRTETEKRPRMKEFASLRPDAGDSRIAMRKKRSPIQRSPILEEVDGTLCLIFPEHPLRGHYAIVIDLHVHLRPSQSADRWYFKVPGLPVSPRRGVGTFELFIPEGAYKEVDFDVHGLWDPRLSSNSISANFDIGKAFELPVLLTTRVNPKITSELRMQTRLYEHKDQTQKVLEYTASCMVELDRNEARRGACHFVILIHDGPNGDFIWEMEGKRTELDISGVFRSIGQTRIRVACPNDYLLEPFLVKWRVENGHSRGRIWMPRLSCVGADHFTMEQSSDVRSALRCLEFKAREVVATTPAKEWVKCGNPTVSRERSKNMMDKLESFRVASPWQFGAGILGLQNLALRMVLQADQVAISAKKAKQSFKTRAWPHISGPYRYLQNHGTRIAILIIIVVLYLDYRPERLHGLRENQAMRNGFNDVQVPRPKDSVGGSGRGIPDIASPSSVMWDTLDCKVEQLKSSEQDKPRENASDKTERSDGVVDVALEISMGESADKHVFVGLKKKDNSQGSFDVGDSADEDSFRDKLDLWLGWVRPLG
ncbi:hypothetical protein AJ80_08023 [Polytolypa hystricis UAMH7299]|uniref:Uncharacterized protein n=1 Tax=Polytolypa hystricis (strain UAMH7299) TaxID=1447883 RepID=A0A2B7XEU0_POLH7|nr:hypothetical protein AJ80_08023 [Polytolypa hystricis UAMH7299]